MKILIVNIVMFVLVIMESVKIHGFYHLNEDSFEPGFFDGVDDCSSKACLSMFLDKRDGQNSELADTSRRASRVLASYRVTSKPWQVSCPCETQYEIIDLGLGNYPRYLATARCTPKTCHNKFNQCKLIHYKVHILKQRETNIQNETPEEQQYVEQIALPEPLRVEWQMKPMKIAVACTSSDGRTN